MGPITAVDVLFDDEPHRTSSGYSYDAVGNLTAVDGGLTAQFAYNVTGPEVVDLEHSNASQTEV